MIGTVLWGANNIYDIRAEDGTLHEHVRLKGKVLPGAEDEHNPLAPGDRVTFDRATATVRITGREPRRNAVVRWNRKRQRLQAIAANVDRMYLVTSAGSPAYRAHFIDRVLAMAELEGIPVALIVNKSDLPTPPDAAEHQRILAEVGYPIFRTCALEGVVPPAYDDAARLGAYSEGAVSVLFGQSGVGKSSLINRLAPGAGLAVGEVSRRYNRGRHTTTLARQVVARRSAGGETILIDTPGVREYDLFGYNLVEIAGGFREFRPFIPDCRMPGCTHLHEPGCAVRAAVTAGTIHQRRYDSYRRIAEDVRGS